MEEEEEEFMLLWYMRPFFIDNAIIPCSNYEKREGFQGFQGLRSEGGRSLNRVDSPGPGRHVTNWQSDGLC